MVQRLQYGGEEMIDYKINLNTLDKIKDFINVAYQLDCKLDLISGIYSVNGKSIMGIFRLDLSRPIVVVINEKKDPNYCPKELEVFMI